MKRLIIVPLLFLAACDAPKPDHKVGTTSISESAIRNALGIVGLDKAQVSVVESKVIPISKQIPFISEEDSILRIRVDGVSLTVNDGDRKLTNMLVKSFDIFYSQKEKQVVKVVSVWPKNVPGSRFPTVDSQEDQMKSVGQTFTGIPATAPKVTLMKALNEAPGAWDAKQIVAYYVLESYAESRISPRAVWVIHAWGMPPFPLMGVPKGADPDSVAVDARNHIRTIIDAKTGKDYGFDSIPQPE